MAQNSLLLKATSVGEEVLFKGSDDPWKSAQEVAIGRYWNGQPARPSKSGRITLTRVSGVWNQSGFLFRFECAYDTLYVRPYLGSGGPIDELWESDVFEVFLRPPGTSDYFEFEVSPLGQWLDVHIIRPREQMDFAWSSHLNVSVFLNEEERLWSGVLKVPFEPILDTAGTDPPRPGDVWGINLFRLAGRPSEREYLAWRPTWTAEPDFHVPSAFGHLILLEED